MSKHERFIIYPLLIMALVYGFIGSPAIQARQETEVFERIEAKEIVIKNGGDVEMVIIKGDMSIGGTVATYTPDGIIGTSMYASPGIFKLNKDGKIKLAHLGRGGRIKTYNEKGDEVVVISSNAFEAGEVEIYNKDGVVGAGMIATDGGGEVWACNKDGVSVTSMGNALGVDSGIIKICNKNGDEIVTIYQTEKGYGGIWVFDRYGEYPAFYGHER